MKRVPPGSSAGGQFAPDSSGKNPPANGVQSFISRGQKRQCDNCGEQFLPAPASRLRLCPQCDGRQSLRIMAREFRGLRPTPLDLPGTPERFRPKIDEPVVSAASEQTDFRSVDPDFPLEGPSPAHSYTDDGKIIAGTESQAHGLAFEQEISNQIFGGFKIRKGSEKWDIPAEVNTSEHGILATKYQNLPVSIKAREAKGAIGFGDALRWREVKEPFVIIVVDWQQVDEETKVPTRLQIERVNPAEWEGLWGPITREHIEELNEIVKDRNSNYKERRERAKQWIADHSDLLEESAFTLNPKIGSDERQNRLQCSMNMKYFYAKYPPRLYHNGMHIPLASVQSSPRNAGAEN